MIKKKKKPTRRYNRLRLFSWPAFLTGPHLLLGILLWGTSVSTGGTPGPDACLGGQVCLQHSCFGEYDLIYGP